MEGCARAPQLSRTLDGLGSSMPMEIGHVESIFRYPVKSVGGERREAAMLGWHGLDGDRRLALRRIDDRNRFPWLTASKLPDLLLFAPHRREGGRSCEPEHRARVAEPGCYAAHALVPAKRARSP
jgi:uncharacterized protein YcbX